ncbi:hypothetical protein LX59_00660 [Azomonas agilis]|uniref:Uncharacterized protein n=1 Tax=Azomonas agilis TaxID=116849 RepID=A0A562J1D1_9GAMM|nr:hypothetical protein [Azomonas agilis]TWH76615.1 hypothetical protein LX59_00660 [Azomonas agilis]
MTQQELAKAKDPDLRASLQAIKRAAELARQTALQTDTGIVVVEGQKMVHVSAQELRQERVL